MKEVWKDTHIFGDCYQVSTFGNVQSKDRLVNASNGSTRCVKAKTLKPYDHQQGYKMVTLGFNMKQQNIFVHRLVAIAFLTNPENKPFVNHKDTNKQNNNVKNIEWCTKSENSIHAYSAGVMKQKLGEDCHFCTISENTAIKIKTMLAQGIKPRRVAEIVGVTPATVYPILKGKSWSHIIIPNDEVGLYT